MIENFFETCVVKYNGRLSDDSILYVDKLRKSHRIPIAESYELGSY